MDEQQEAEYTDFVSSTWPALVRTAYLLVGDHQRAEDLAQSACVKVYAAWPRVSRMDQPRAYARKVVVNQATSWWRRRSSREVVGLTLVDRAEQDDTDRVVESASLWAAVLQLPPRQRAVVVLRYYEDLSEEEIAAALGVSRGTVKAHAHAALGSLRRGASESGTVSTGETP